MILFKLFLYTEVRVEVNFFTFEYRGVPVPSVKKTILSPLNYLGTNVRNQLTMYIRMDSISGFSILFN